MRYFSLGAIAAALFLGMAILTVLHVEAVTITIDGILTDWSGIQGFTDSPTDAGGGSGDLTAVYLTSDSTYLYVRFDETLTANKNKISSDGFSVALDTNSDGVIDTRFWILVDSSGNATTQVEKPLGTYTNTGNAIQSCSPEIGRAHV